MLDLPLVQVNFVFSDDGKGNSNLKIKFDRNLAFPPSISFHLLSFSLSAITQENENDQGSANCRSRVLRFNKHDQANKPIK